MAAVLSPTSSKHRDVLLSYDSCYTASLPREHQSASHNKSVSPGGGDNGKRDDDVALLTSGTDSSESDAGMHPLVTGVGTRRSRANGGAGPGGKRRRGCGVVKVCRSINENSCDLSLSEGDMPVIVGMADLPGITDIPSITGGWVGVARYL